MRKRGVQALRVLRCIAVAAANGGGQHDWQLHMATRHIGIFSQVVVDLVHAHTEEVDKHQLNDRS